MSKAKLDYGYGYNETNSIAIIWEIDDVRKVIKDYKMSINEIEFEEVSHE